MKRLIDPKDISTMKYANNSGEQLIVTRLVSLYTLITLIKSTSESNEETAWKNEVIIPQLVGCASVWGVIPLGYYY